MAGLLEVAQLAGLSNAAARRVFDAVAELLARGELVRIDGFGQLEPGLWKPRQLRSKFIPGGVRFEPARPRVRLVTAPALLHKLGGGARLVVRNTDRRALRRCGMCRQPLLDQR